MAAPAFVQGATGQSSGATNPMVMSAFGSSVATGNLLVVNICDDSGTDTSVTAVVDNFGNTYTQIVIPHGTASMQVWYARNVVGGASLALSITWDTGTTAGVTAVAQEFSGIHRLSPLDVYAYSAPTTSTSPNSGASARVALADELVIGAAVHAGATSAFTLGAGFTNLTSLDVTNRTPAMESAAITTGGTQTATFTIAASREWICVVLAFRVVPTVTSTVRLRPHAFSPGLAR